MPTYDVKKRLTRTENHNDDDGNNPTRKGKHERKLWRSVEP